MVEKRHIQEGSQGGRGGRHSKNNPGKTCKNISMIKLIESKTRSGVHTKEDNF